VVEIPAEFPNRPIRDGDGVDQSLVVHLFRAKQPQIIRGRLNVFEPALPPEIPPADSKGDFVFGALASALDT
jgi:hypothetical protein